jgi:Leucine-rich repeat (LRR) protein
MLLYNNKILKQLLEMYRKLLPRNGMKDEHGNKIVTINLLRQFVGTLCCVDPKDVFVYSTNEPGCCGKNPIAIINDVKIRCTLNVPESICTQQSFRSLEIFYNEIHNKITEEYRISLKKVLAVQL